MGHDHWVNNEDVGDGAKGGEPGQDLGLEAGALFFKLEKAVQCVA